MKKLYYKFINRKYISKFRENTRSKYKVCLEKLGEKIMYYLTRVDRIYFADEFKAFLTDRMNADIYVFEHAASTRKITEEYYTSKSKQVSEIVSAISDIFIRDFVEIGDKFKSELKVVHDDKLETYSVEHFINSLGIYTGDELFFGVHTYHAEIVDDDERPLAIETYNTRTPKCYVHMFVKNGVFYALDCNGELDVYYTPIRLSILDSIEKSVLIATKNINLPAAKERKKAILDDILHLKNNPLND